jgi:subtilisin family serine protease
MESLGVDIISSSLGYIDWYDTTQLDGNTAVITQVAAIAASLGVIVVNAAGNEGDNPLWRLVTPPADGDSVIAVGSVDSQRNLAASSSRGPTSDGRIKPDFCGMGVGDYIAAYAGGYTFGSGTSYSTPLIAGGIALLLDHNPSYRLSDILTAMKLSSSRGRNPDYNYGWGIPDFVLALEYIQNGGPPDIYDVRIYPQPAIGEITISILFDTDFPKRWSIHDLSGLEIYSSGIVRESESRSVSQYWYGRNSDGQDVASGIYICMVDFGDRTILKKFCFLRE